MWFSQLRNRISSWFLESIEDQPSGSQQSFDTELPRAFLNQTGILPPFDLSRYLALYTQDALAYAVIQSSVYLTTSPVTVVADSGDLRQYVESFNRRIDIERVVYRLALDSDLYGFGLSEIVGDGPTLASSRRVLGLNRIDPRSIIIQPDERGRFRFFRQRPFAGQAIGSLPAYDVPIDPAAVVFVSSDSPLTIYGQSLLQASYCRFAERNRLIDAAIASGENYANAIVLWFYQSDRDLPEDNPEIQTKRSALKRAIRYARENNSADIFGAGTGQFDGKVIGPQSVPDITKQIDLITADIIIAAGLSPATLGFNFGSGVTTSAASSRQTINNICVKQNRIIAALSKLYGLLPFIETECPAGEFVCRMEPPTLESLKENSERMTIDINNAHLLLRSGAISPQDAASMLGFVRWNNEDRLAEYLTTPEQQNNDPNETQAARTRIDSLNARKVPSNNPAGIAATNSAYSNTGENPNENN